MKNIFSLQLLNKFMIKKNIIIKNGRKVALSTKQNIFSKKIKYKTEFSIFFSKYK